MGTSGVGNFQEVDENKHNISTPKYSILHGFYQPHIIQIFRYLIDLSSCQKSSSFDVA